MEKRDKDDDEGISQGRYVVDHVVVSLSGKKFLQICLDKGDANGWKLIKLVNSDKNSFILIVWERPACRRIALRTSHSLHVQNVDLVSSSSTKFAKKAHGQSNKRSTS